MYTKRDRAQCHTKYLGISLLSSGIVSENTCMSSYLFSWDLIETRKPPVKKHGGNNGDSRNWYSGTNLKAASTDVIE